MIGHPIESPDSNFDYSGRANVIYLGKGLYLGVAHSIEQMPENSMIYIGTQDEANHYSVTHAEVVLKKPEADLALSSKEAHIYKAINHLRSVLD